MNKTFEKYNGRYNGGRSCVHPEGLLFLKFSFSPELRVLVGYSRAKT